MILRVPNYYKLFNCIANNCKHPCCSNGWEIDVDDDTYNYYKSIDSTNMSILNKISSLAPHHILCKNGICPFFNKNNLCDIYINLGEEHMCKICQEHPRFYEWFSNVKEGGIGLCCEESARIILTDNSPFGTYEVNIDNEDFASINSLNSRNSKTINETSFILNKDLFLFLEKCRTMLFNLFDSDISLDEKIRISIVFACNVQQNILNKNFIIPKFEDVRGKKNTDFNNIFKYILSLEIFNDSWRDTISTVSNINWSNYNFSNLQNTEFQLEKYLTNIAKYFLWRYFLKASFDEDVYSKIVLLVISVLTIKLLFLYSFEKNKTISITDCIDIVRRYSEEIEYCEDNILSIFSDSYNNSLFSADNLLNLFS